MKDSDYRLLLTLRDYKNITHASKALYMTQPTFTKRLKTIELELGITLAIRTNQGITLTSAGEYLAEKAQEILMIVDEIQDHITEIKELTTGTLRIGATNSITRYTLPFLLKNFQEHYPYIKFELVTDLSSQIARMVERKELDIGFVQGEIPYSGTRLLYHTEQAYLASCVPVDLKKRKNSLPYITYFKDKCSQQLLDEWWNDVCKTPFPKGISVKHGDICKEMILKGLGYSIFFVKDYMKDYPQFTEPLFYSNGQPFVRNTWLLYQSGKLMAPELEAFLKCILPEDYAHAGRT